MDTMVQTMYSKLVDVPKLQALTESLSEVTGLANAVIDVEGTFIAHAGWQEVCTRFHRVNGKTCQRCIESDTSLVESVTQGKSCATYRCHNGLNCTAAPIIVNGRRLANVFTGQFLTETPDLEFFSQQARQFGFDEASYLEAIARVPILEQAQVESVTRLSARLADLLSDSGMNHLHLEQAEKLVFARDAELVQARDAAEAANRAKNLFLANMSHELLTPMNGIMGMTDMALRRATDHKQIDWLNKSKACTQHLLEIINDVLDTARIEAEQMTLEEKNFSLAQVLDNTLQMREAPARAKGLRLFLEIAPGLPERLCGDALRLRQILDNFVGNAVKFSERGQITVRAHAVTEDSHSLLLRLEVGDQGIGISAEQQGKLFHPFTQVDDSSTRKYGGTGLGLAIVRRLARLMGGEAGVISEEGVGSTFWATVRLRRALAGP